MSCVCWPQAAQTNGFAPHASQEQLDCFQYLRECMISNQSPYRNPSGLSAQGLSEGQLSEAAHYFLANLERLLNANLDILTEVTLLHMMKLIVKGPLHRL